MMEVLECTCTYKQYSYIYTSGFPSIYVPCTKVRGGGAPSPPLPDAYVSHTPINETRNLHAVYSLRHSSYLQRVSIGYMALKQHIMYEVLKILKSQGEKESVKACAESLDGQLNQHHHIYIKYPSEVQQFLREDASTFSYLVQLRGSCRPRESFKFIQKTSLSSQEPACSGLGDQSITSRCYCPIIIIVSFWGACMLIHDKE